jgi:hypothetical protein
VVAERDLQILEWGLDLNVGVIVDQKVQPRLAQACSRRTLCAVTMSGISSWLSAHSTMRLATFWLIPIHVGAAVLGGSTQIASTVYGVARVVVVARDSRHGRPSRIRLPMRPVVGQ